MTLEYFILGDRKFSILAFTNKNIGCISHWEGQVCTIQRYKRIIKPPIICLSNVAGIKLHNTNFFVISCLEYYSRHVCTIYRKGKSGLNDQR